MKRSLALSLVLSAALSALLAHAAPAPWYRWQHPEDAQFICAQTPPGNGWRIVAGPFQDIRCQKPGMPGQG